MEAPVLRNTKPRHDGHSRTKARKSVAVFQDLKRRILTGDVRADSPITEQALAQHYTCSQSTVREALLSLQECGLVERKGYQGTFVTDPGHVEAQLLLRLRIEIETAGLTKSALNVTAGQLEELRDLDQQFEACKAQRDTFGCAELDRSLHLSLFKIAQMPALEPMLVRTTMVLQRLTCSSPRPEAVWRKSDLTPHHVVLDALETGDAHVAAEAMKTHILSSAVLLAPHFYGTDTEGLNQALLERPGFCSDEYMIAI